MTGKIPHAIFIDDDEPTNVYNQIIVQEADLIEKYQIFDSAISALEFLKNHDQTPDFILLDINMPCMSGWQFLEEYIKIKKSTNLPKVIMLTTSIATFDEKRAAKNPLVCGFRQKPLTQEMLEEIAASMHP